MDFDDSPREAEFRAEARAWLSANAPGFEGVPTSDDELMATARAWQGAKAEAGWACISWPQEYGGRGGSRLEADTNGQHQLLGDSQFEHDIRASFLLAKM